MIKKSSLVGTMIDDHEKEPQKASHRQGPISHTFVLPPVRSKTYPSYVVHQAVDIKREVETSLALPSRLTHVAVSNA